MKEDNPKHLKQTDFKEIYLSDSYFKEDNTEQRPLTWVRKIEK